MIRAASALALAFVAALFAGSARGADGEVLEARVETAEHPAPRALRVIRFDDIDFFEVEEIAFLFRAGRIVRADLGRAELIFAEKTIELTVGSPFVELDGSTANLGSSVDWYEGRMIAPVRLLTEVIDPLVRERVVWSPDERVLRLDRGDPNIVSVTFIKGSEETGVEVRTSRELPAVVRQTVAKKAREVHLRILGGVLPDKLIGALPAVGLVDSLTASQTPAAADFVFRLDDELLRLTSAERTSSTKLVLRFSRNPPARGEDFADTTLASEDAELDETLAEIESGAGRFAVRRVVLDPGHGGSDAGGASPRGDREKDVSLVIARRLRSELLSRDASLDVRLTREDDRFLTNDERRKVAEDLGADLFVSIHCDGWFDEDRRGFSVEMWGRSTVSEGWSMPPSAVKDGDIERETKRLAEAVAGEMDRALSMPNRGVVSAELQVLEGLRMPGLLIECGTLTNAEDRKLLVGNSFQEKLTGAIADAIVEFRTSLGAGEEDSDFGGLEEPEEQDGEL